MRLFGILLLCCFTFGTASAFLFGNIQWPSWITSLFSGSVDKLTDKVCRYMNRHPDRAALTIQKINETLQRTNQTRDAFVTTIDYLNSEENQNKLVNGTAACTTFFKEIRNAIQTDLNNKNADLESTKKAALAIIIDTLNKLKDLFS